MGVALEPDWVLEPPDIPRDLEQHPTKRKLIPPVSEVIHDKRKRAKQLSKPVEIDRVKSKGVEIDHIKENPKSFKNTELIFKILKDLEQPNPPPSRFWLWFNKVDRKFVQAVTKLLDALYPA